MTGPVIDAAFAECRRGSQRFDARDRLDTETPGLDPFDGHRVVEIGCIEMVNCIPTGREFHHYINPEREMPHARPSPCTASSAEFLRGKPRFAEIADDFLAFIDGAGLVDPQRRLRPRLHQCRARAGLARAAAQRDRVVDTLALARRRHPGAPNSSMRSASATASICPSARSTARCSIAELLAEVYVELVGGTRRALGLVTIQRGAGGSSLASCGERSARGRGRFCRASRAFGARSDDREAASRLFVDDARRRASGSAD